MSFEETNSPDTTLKPVSRGMKITHAESILLRIPPRQRTISDAQSRVEAVEFIAVRIDTDSGLCGWGFNWNYMRGMGAAKTMLDEVYLPILKGKDPAERKALCAQLLHSTHFIGRVGVALVAACAVELALWDIHCKSLGQPLWRVLGPVHDRVKAYNTDGGWLSFSQDELVRDMTRLVERGFDKLKMKIGLADPREDFRRVQAVRKAIGRDTGLMLDVNTCWDLKTALTWGPRFEALDIEWLEEPLHPFDIEGHARLARAMKKTPLAVGETVYTKYAFRDFIERKAAGILQADVTKLSGIDEWREVAALAAEHHLPVIPHTNVQQKVHAQLAAATPNVPMVEYCYESLADIWKEPLTVKEGYYTLPEEPGLGCEFKSGILEAHRVR